MYIGQVELEDGAMIQVYTGEGKGKTTAALGIALRAAGAGLKVYIGQFIKGGLYSELKAIKRLKNIKLEQYGRDCFLGRTIYKKDITLANKGLARAAEAVLNKDYDMVILDEINPALHYKLLNLEDVMSLIEKTPPDTELILTGRYAPAKILELADLVSDIKEVKHYFKKGLQARKGIEF